MYIIIIIILYIHLRTVRNLKVVSQSPHLPPPKLLIERVRLTSQFLFPDNAAIVRGKRSYVSTAISEMQAARNFYL